MMLPYPFLLFAASCIALVADAHPLNARQAAATQEKFNIYAYGKGIRGLPIFYADGEAQIGDAAQSTAKLAHPVYFTIQDSSPNAWIAHRNSTGTKLDDARSETTVFSLPSADTPDANVHFKESSPKLLASDDASAFSYYGSYVMIDAENASCYAVPTEADGVYSLVLGDPESKGIPVTLRTIAPASDDLF